jgi:putative transposase
VILTYKYRLRQRSYGRRLRRHATALNQVWNYDVAVQRKHEADWKAGAPRKRWPSRYDFDRITAGTSKELDTHAGSIHEVNRLFVQGRDKRRKAPRFRHSFGPKRSLGWVPFRQGEDRRISGNSIRFAGKTYRWFGDRPPPKAVKGGAFVEDARGRWWVCLQVEVPEDQEHGTATIGVDLGLKTLATLSTGEKIESPKAYRQLEAKLAAAQRAHNRQRVRAIHIKIKNVRDDHQHKETTRLIRMCRFIAVGDVSPTKLVKTWMAKSVLDAGWGGFREKLRYKARRHGVQYVDVDEKFTTQACSSCGDIPPSSPKGMDALGIREWKCSSCGVTHDRDVNAARNILTLGLSAGPLVEEIGGSSKRLAGKSTECLGAFSVPAARI